MVGIGALFAVLSFCIWKLKWDFLIAGYNTASKEEKKKVNIELVRKRMGILLLVMAGIMAIGGVFSERFTWIGAAAPMAIVVVALGSIVWVNKGTRINSNRDEDKSEVKGALLISAVIALPVLLLLGVIYSSSTKPMEVTLNKEVGTISISGPYSDNINFNEIQSVEIVDGIPKTSIKLNGVGIGDVQAGTYKLESGEKVRLHIQSKNPKCIFIKMNNGKMDVYINFDDDTKTEEIYNSIKTGIK